LLTLIIAHYAYDQDKQFATDNSISYLV
jgi:hypothetical protein